MSVCLLSLGRHDLCALLVFLPGHNWTEGGRAARTLNISNALLQDTLERPWVFKLLTDARNDGLGQLLLLLQLDLALVADPRVEHGLGLGSGRGPLLKLVGLRLKLGGFLAQG